jgi:hypothetical protein
VIKGVESETEAKEDESRYFTALNKADEVVADGQLSSFRGVQRPVSTLLKNEQTVGRSAVSETLGDKSFNDF